MAKEDERIRHLLKAWTSRTITPAEERELARWIGDNYGQSALHAHVIALVDQYKPGELLPAVEWEAVFEKIQATKRSAPGESQQRVIRRMPSWLRWGVAAVAAATISAIAVLVLSDLSGGRSSDMAAETSADVSAPRSNRAVITLANGRIIPLDSLQNGLLAEEGNVQLLKEADGEITYQAPSGEAVEHIQYNTLSNPRGSKVISMTLSDGSHVWLNAGSAVTYPVAFSGNERKVVISGEAYFEVAPDKTKPFYVIKGDMEVKVLGTHFNVNAYNDESDIRVTLLEGRVELASGKHKTILKPGQQGVLPINTAVPFSGRRPDGGILVSGDVDLDAVMAWKNGFFQFDYTPVETVLKELSRWYDIQVIYENGKPDIKLWGEMKRDLTLNQVLRGLGKIGVQFRIEGKNLIVMK